MSDCIHRSSQADRPRIGIDLGGTKIEGIVLAPASHAGRDQAPTPGTDKNDDGVWARRRIAAPRHDYERTIAAIHELVRALENDIVERAASLAQDAQEQQPVPIGIGMPGSIAPKSGLVQNANSTWLNGRPFQRDLAAKLGRDVRCTNDADCFALSEAVDGAGATARTVFGVILGTGCGGAIVRDKRLSDEPRAIGGEWGHNPLPWPLDRGSPDAAPAESTGQSDGLSDSLITEHSGPICWCGKQGCMETWVSGPALAADHARATGQTIDAQTIAAHAKGATDTTAAQRTQARASLNRHASRLARGLAGVVNLIDPDVIVLGGGLSLLDHLYDDLPSLMAPYIFAQDQTVQILPPKWGDASGVRGAAWQWD